MSTSSLKLSGLPESRGRLERGPIFILIVIFVAACIIPAVAYCSDCFSTAVSACSAQNKQVVSFHCNPDDCLGGGEVACTYECGDGMMPMPEMQPMPTMPSMPSMPSMGGR